MNMPLPTPPPIDIVTLAIALASAFFSPRRGRLFVRLKLKMPTLIAT